MMHNVRVTLVVEATTDLSVQEAAESMADALRDWGVSIPSDDYHGYVSVLVVTTPASQEIGPAPVRDMDRQ